MDTLVTIVFILIIGGAAVAAGRYLWGRNNMSTDGLKPGSGFEDGMLTVTGVSDVGAADKNNQSFVTVSGTILGVSVAPTEVYGTLILDPSRDKPYIGEEIPVVYKPGKVATSWRFRTTDI